jgi:hypothetical protein
MLQARRWRVRFPMRWLNSFSLRNPSRRNMALGSTQPLTGMSTRNLSGGSRAAGAWDWQSYRHLWADCLEGMEASMSHNPMGLHGLLQGYLYFYIFTRFSSFFLYTRYVLSSKLDHPQVLRSCIRGMFSYKFWLKVILKLYLYIRLSELINRDSKHFLCIMTSLLIHDIYCLVLRVTSVHLKLI